MHPRLAERVSRGTCGRSRRRPFGSALTDRTFEGVLDVSRAALKMAANCRTGQLGRLPAAGALLLALLSAAAAGVDASESRACRSNWYSNWGTR